MNIVEIDHELATDFFRADPLLCKIGLSDEDLFNLAHTTSDKTYVLFPECDWIGIEANNKLIAVCAMEPFTNQTVELHIYICTFLHHLGINKEVHDIIETYIAEQTTYLKGIVMAPITCPQVYKTLQKFGFEVEGTIKNSFIWRKELVDLLILGKSVNREPQAAEN